VQNEQGAQTNVIQLNDQQRVEEVARILGGATVTDKARVAAAEMIASSQP
jgi:DNA repair protein RecN (Recombination protein N)